MPETLSPTNAVRQPPMQLPSWARRPLDPDPEAVVTLPGAPGTDPTYAQVEVTPAAPVGPPPPPRVDSRKPAEDNTLMYIGIAAAGIGLVAAVYYASR